MTIEPKISVASRAHRTLRDNPRFRFTSTDNSESFHRDEVGVAYGEVIGVYENPPGIEPKRVVITERAIGCLGTSPARWISFDDIETTEGPKEKLIEDTITVVLKSGIRTELRIAGGDDRFKDVFGFVRFIDRVVEDRRPGG